MRFIRNNTPPEALIRCLASRRDAGQALNYDEVGQIEVNDTVVSVTKEIRKAKITDQGGICAYTMMRIDENSCHNEHMIPRSVSRQNGQVEQTLDYRNIVACHPKREEPGGCGFGAVARGTKHLAVTPLDPACEQRIRFDRGTGRAEPTDPGDAEISALLNNVLILNHDTLVGRRLGAIEKAGVGVKSRKQLSERQARSLANSILQYRRGKNLTPFCIALAHAAVTHATVIEKRRRQRAGRN